MNIGIKCTNQDKQVFQLQIVEMTFHQLYEQIQNHIILLEGNQNLNSKVHSPALNHNELYFYYVNVLALLISKNK